MAALTDLSDVVNRLTGGNSGAPELLFFHKDGRVGANAATPADADARWISLWMYNGAPSGGAKPTSADYPTNSTAGSMRQTNPASGKQKWLLGATYASNVPGSALIYDRLAHCTQSTGGTGSGGFVANSTSEQVCALTPTRYNGTTGSAVGNQIWIEVYSTDLTSTASATIKAKYTNQDGTANKETPIATFNGSSWTEKHRAFPLTLADGDTGVRTIQSITFGSAMGSANTGAFGVTLVRPILTLPVSAPGVCVSRDLIAGFPQAPEIAASACLAIMHLSNFSTTSPSVWGNLSFVEK